MSKKQRLLFWGMMALLMILRIAFPTMDPPPDVSFSGGVYFDEGNQCHNERSYMLFGNLYPDDWKFTLYNPILPPIKLVIFKLFGIGMVQVRSVDWLFAFLGLYFFFAVMRRNFRFPLALFGTFLLGCNYIYLVWNKIGTLETPQTFFIILSLYFLDRFDKSEKALWLSLSGAAAFAVYMSKNISVYFLPVPFAALLLVLLVPGGEYRNGWRSTLHRLGFLAAGFLAISAAWYLLFYLPNREWILYSAGDYLKAMLVPSDLRTAWQNLLRFNWVESFGQVPVVWLTAVAAVPLVYRRWWRGKANLTEVGFALLFLAHTLFFIVFNYRPTRYFVPAVPGMIFLTVVVIDRLTAANGSENPSRRTLVGSILFFAADVLWLTIAACFCFLPLASRWFGPFPRPRLSLLFVGAAALVIAVGWVLNGVRRGIPALRPRSAAAMALAFFIGVGTLFGDGANYFTWVKTRNYKVYSIGREFGAKLRDAYIAGLTAPAFVMENRHKALFLYENFVNYTNTFERFPLTHAMVSSYNAEISYYFQKWPQRMAHAALLAVYNLKNSHFHLYSWREPFFTAAAAAGDGISATLTHPGGKPYSLELERLDFRRDPLAGEIDTADITRIALPAQTVVPGENHLRLPPVSGARVLLSPRYPRLHKTLRYEAEMARAQTGEKMWAPAASDRWVRVFRADRDKPGYMVFGQPLMFAEGLLHVRCTVRGERMRTRLRSVGRVEIFARDASRVLASRDLRFPTSTAGVQTVDLYVALPRSRELEFRIYASGLADLRVDCFDLEYDQGMFVR